MKSNNKARAVYVAVKQLEKVFGSKEQRTLQDIEACYNDEYI